MYLLGYLFSFTNVQCLFEVFLVLSISDDQVIYKHTNKTKEKYV